MKVWIIIAVAFVLFGFFVWHDQRKKNQGLAKSSKNMKGALQEFLMIEGFKEDGTVVVNGNLHRLMHVGDLNLYSMAVEEIQTGRDQFKEMLQHLDNPFQISVQARKANYTDYINHTEAVIDEHIKAYQNSLFSEYAQELKAYIKEEAQKPRTDRENILVISVVPKMGGEEIESQMERLDREQAFVEMGLTNIGLPFKTLEPVEVVEAIQNFWNRERAVTQRYRDAVYRHTQAPYIHGTDTIVREEVLDSVRAQT